MDGAPDRRRTAGRRAETSLPAVCGCYAASGSIGGIELAASGRHAAYVGLVTLHVISALVGFGAVGLAGVYAGRARRIDRPGVLEETVRYFRARALGEVALVLVPVLGVAAVGIDPSGGGLGQVWVGVALALWVLAAGLVGLVVRPARAALRAGLGLPPAGTPPLQTAGAAAPDGPAVRRAATRLSWSAAACDVIFLLAVIDMVIQPG